MVTIIDANYFLRWFLNDIPAQNQQVKELLVKASPESIVIDRITIAEITYVLRGMRYNKQQITFVIREFCRIESIRPLDEILSSALSLFEETTLDFEDCYLAATVRHTPGMSLGTFDKQLQDTVSTFSSRT